jgi:uncharacterized alpha/beta hydrolase family protein
MVTSEFNSQTGILEAKFVGEVYLSEIIDYIIYTKENTSYPRLLKIITVASNANFNFSVDDLGAIITENEKSLEKYDYIIDAIITENPQVTAISMLYQELEKNKKYKFNIFSTKEAALKWLGNF